MFSVRELPARDQIRYETTNTHIIETIPMPLPPEGTDANEYMDELENYKSLLTMELNLTYQASYDNSMLFVNHNQQFVTVAYTFTPKTLDIDAEFDQFMHNESNSDTSDEE